MLRQHVYRPKLRGIERHWTQPVHVYTYLLYHIDERVKLFQELDALAPNHPATYIITHPKIPIHLTLSNVETDYIFVNRLEALIAYHTRLQAEYDQAQRYVPQISKLWVNYLQAIKSIQSHVIRDDH